MRRRFAVLATVFSALVLAPALLAQAPPGNRNSVAREKGAPAELLGKLPDAIEEMLAAALHSNPDILRAEARVEEARARLNSARLKVTEDVTHAFHERTKLREIVGVRERQAANHKSMVQTGRAPQSEFEAVLASLTEARAQLAQVEARIRFLMGVGGTAGSDRRPGPSSGGKTAGLPRPEIPEKIRELLDRKVSVTLGGDQSLKEFFEKETLGDPNTIIYDTEALEALPEARKQRKQPHGKIIEIKDVPLRTALLAIADFYGIAFVFREYGVLITTQERAANYNAATIPPDLPH